MKNLKLSDKDIRTIAKIVTEKAVEMNKRGCRWIRGNESLTCIGMGKIANKILKPLGEKYDFEKFFNGKSKKK